MTKVLRRRITEEMALIGAEVIKATGEVIKDLEERSESSLKRIAGRMKTARDRTAQVIEQALKVNAGSLHIPDRLVSVFDPEARPIRCGKIDRLTEFGYKVRLTETEERLVTEHEVSPVSPPDNALLMGGVKEHCQRTGSVPQGAVTDRGFWDPGKARLARSAGITNASSG